MPLSREGSDDENNLALSCRACNLHKSNSTGAVDALTQEEVRFFNPRIDDWNMHFQFDVETGQIQSLTAIGRVAVNRLRMNREAQIVARLS